MGASITLAGESLIAQKQGAQQILTVSRFILANVPGLDPNGPVDRAAGKPAAGQIVGTYDVTDAGYVNPNQVVYSLMMGSDIGDFDWNWIGLETAENVLLMVAYVPTQQKRRNIPPLQLGNNVTRNFLVVFDGAQALTGLTIDASTWQHDFTVRLAGIDERERQSNRDIFGRACFFGSALQLEKVGAVYQLKPGTAYVEGVRLQRSAALAVVPPAFPTTAWLDVALQRELNDVVASWSVVWGAGKVDYVDSAGVQHYCVAIADLTNSNTITDSRPVENIAGPLVAHFAARVGDYPDLRARATTKDDVDLGNLPNAKSDSLELDSSESLATSKAVATLWKSISVNVSSFAADRVLTAAERGLVELDASGGNRSFTLPAATAELGVVDFIVRRKDNSGNRLEVKASGADKILFHTHLNTAGYPFLVLLGTGDWWHLRSDGDGHWWPVSRLDNTPVGRPVFDTTTLFPPGGYGPLSGSIFTRADWPWLWDHARQSGMLTTEAARTGMEGGWTSGDGMATFRGPEGRGVFLRILDAGRGIDPSRVAGSEQADQFKSHNHALGAGNNNLQNSSTPNANDVGRTESAGFTGYVTAATGGSETRPRNIAWPGRIKLI